MIRGMTDINWYHTVRSYTEQLVNIHSESPGAGERVLADTILSLLHADGGEALYTTSGLDPLVGDLHQRQNVYAFLRGSQPATLILLGHFDTVGTKDYGLLEPLACDPGALASHVSSLLPSSERDSDTSDWLFGRGTADMKSGIAVNLALMRRLAQEAAQKPLPLSLLMLATPDEEHESAGVLQAVSFLTQFREQHGLNYLGVLNTDCVMARYPGDPHRYLYSGTVGKVLPSFLCIGREGHVGIPFAGLDANLLQAELIQDLSMNLDFCDIEVGQITAPPVTLHAADLKTSYDVQLPLMASFYLNVLTLKTTPSELLVRLQARAEQALKRVLKRMDEAEKRWQQQDAALSGRPDVALQERSGRVLLYADLYEQVQMGKDELQQSLQRVWRSGPPHLDGRQRSLHLAAHLWTLSGLQGPAILLYFSPPYYPAVAPVQGSLQEAIAATLAAHPELPLRQLPYFPYISDMSYLCLDPEIASDAISANMPVWQSGSEQGLPGAYTLPLTEMRQLQLPVVNWGPYARGVHRRDEAVLMPYTFGLLPQLLYETITHLAAQ